MVGTDKKTRLFRMYFHGKRIYNEYVRIFFISNPCSEKSDPVVIKFHNSLFDSKKCNMAPEKICYLNDFFIFQLVDVARSS
ncbi:Uncharacterized protein dnm_026600 [Desulfonema magnum]|uniref:Uncharacterized protein n=1 Tax=Desulfonema magnum TaxID=45655 RepID=A0A975GM82_9BACT|nr:Uncharacterized protein dnm_026600 [Desulfonema magnum]